MFAPTPLKAPMATLATGATPVRVAAPSRSWHRARAVLAVGATALIGAWGVAQWEGPAPTLAQEVQSFQERVTAGTAVAQDSAATEVLASRYLVALSPDLRQRIADQVRAEQRSGLTPQGNGAFVMRRLALYEAALQQGGGADAR